MKILHLSDLHLGKRLSEFSLIEDQRDILQKILSLADAEAPDAAVIAGDVYDKSAPSAEAVQLFDDFLSRLAEKTPHVFVISGNHDSPERIAFAYRLIERSGVHLSPVYEGAIAPIELRDAWGSVFFYMLPFLKPAHVRRFFPDAQIGSYSDAIRVAVDAMRIDPAARSVLITHQFVTGAARSESEDISVGGTDNVDAQVFEAFDYVALGHLHSPQNVSSPRIRYCGTPLKYSFSEAEQVKSVTIAELGEKGSLEIRTLPLTPMRDLREKRGTYMELTARSDYEGTNTQDYLHITLTDEDEVPDAMQRLRVIYPNLMKLDYDNTRTRAGASPLPAGDIERVSPLSLFSEFYRLQNGQPLSQAQTDYAKKRMEEIWEEEK